MLKYPDPKLAWRYACYSHREWLRLYREYCCGEKLAVKLSRALDLQHAFEAAYTSIPVPVRRSLRPVTQFSRSLLGQSTGD